MGCPGAPHLATNSLWDMVELRAFIWWAAQAEEKREAGSSLAQT